MHPKMETYLVYLLETSSVMKEGDIWAKGQTKVVALPADNARKSVSKNYTPSPSVHDNEAINIAKECPVREVMNTNYC